MLHKDVLLVIPDAHLRKTFDLYNFLKKRYQCLLLSEFDIGRLSLVYGRKPEKIDHSSDENFANAMDQIAAKYSDKRLVYMPVTENGISLFLKYKDKTPHKHWHYTLPKEDDFQLARNKYELNQFLLEKGLPTPKIYSKEDIPSLHENFKPLVAKRRNGGGAVGLFYVNESSHLSKLDNLDWDNYVVQEKLTGSVVKGEFYFMSGGKVISHYGHERIRTSPPSGGVTVFSVSRVDPDMRELGEQILSALNWEGIAMIEFMCDEQMKPKVIEINPRVWGSILLSDFTGTQLMDNYIRVAIGEKPTVTVADEGKYIRWFLPLDLINARRPVGRTKAFWNFKNTIFEAWSHANVFSALAWFMYYSFNLGRFNKGGKKILKKLGIR